MDDLRSHLDELRNRAAVEGHPRLAEAVAHLAIGAEWGIAFASSLGAIQADQATEILAQTWQVLLELARGHGHDLKEASPPALFLGTIQEALEAGHIYLADTKTGNQVVVGDGQGTKLGWVDDQYAYLLPTEAFKFVTEHLKYRGGLPLGEHEVRRQLIKAQAMLPDGESKSARGKWCEGKVRRVMTIKRHLICPP